MSRIDELEKRVAELEKKLTAPAAPITGWYSHPWLGWHQGFGGWWYGWGY